MFFSLFCKWLPTSMRTCVGMLTEAPLSVVQTLSRKTAAKLSRHRHNIHFTLALGFPLNFFFSPFLSFCIHFCHSQFLSPYFSLPFSLLCRFFSFYSAFTCFALCCSVTHIHSSWCVSLSSITLAPSSSLFSSLYKKHQ